MPERAEGLIERCQGFVEYLRARDFSIGVDRALRIQRVLCRVGGDLDPSRLGAVLAPLVVFTESVMPVAVGFHAYMSRSPLVPASVAKEKASPESA